MRIAVMLIFAGGLLAEPVIRDLAPRGAMPGQTIKLLLTGSGLESGAQMITTVPGAVSRLAPAADLMRPGTELPFLLEIRKDAPVGVYPVRVSTKDGLSNVVLFSISGLEEQEEIESKEPKQSNGGTEAAQALRIPGVMNGTLTEADIDFYKFTAQAGQKIVFEVEGASIGSAIDPALEILDSAGKTVAKNDDAPGVGVDVRMEVSFAKAGAYFARVHDSKYSNQRVNHYRLKAGSYPFADAMYPLAVQRGKPAKVTLSGGNLPQQAEVEVNTNSERRYAQVMLPGSQSLPMLVELSDLEESSATELKPEVAVNGRISSPKKVDKYKLAVKPGEHWVLEVMASKLGTSRLDALLTVRDGEGKKLASRDDLGGADPVLPFEAPEGVKEVTVELEDLLGRGGPDYGYRLVARHAPADFLVNVVTPYVNVPAGGTAKVDLQVQRRGYDGALRLTIPNLPPGLHQSGGTVATAAAQQRFDDPNPRFSATRSTITITADADALPQAMALEVVGTALTRNGKIVRKAETPAMVVGVAGLRQKSVTAPWLEMQLPAAVTAPALARMSSPIPLVRIAQGVEFPLGYRVERAQGVQLRGRPRNNIATSLGNLRILQGPPGKTPDSGSFLVSTNFETPAEKFDMLLDATVEMEGKTETVTAPMVTIEVALGYQLRLAAEQFAVKSPGKIEIAGTVYREPTFEGGLVKIQALDLPEAVSCAPADVPAEQTRFSLSCEAKAGAEPGVYEIRINSEAPETGSKAKDTYKIPDYPVKIKVTAQ